jgi:single-strand DNA-binding protein
MASLNRVILAGNLTRDPEVRYLPSGMAVGDMSLAISESFKNKAGEQVESTCFVDIVVWGKQAETCEKYLSKGSPVLIDGSLQLDKWTTKEGENRSRLRVRAMRVQFLGAPRGGEAREGKSKGSVSAGPPAEPPAEPRAEPEPTTPAERPAEDGPADDDNLPF